MDSSSATVSPSLAHGCTIVSKVGKELKGAKLYRCLHGVHASSWQVIMPHAGKLERLDEESKPAERIFDS